MNTIVVIWTRKARLKHKSFPIDKPEQAFNWYWRINSDQIVVYDANDNPVYPSFSENIIPNYIQNNPSKTEYKRVFLEWFKENHGKEVKK